LKVLQQTSPRRPLEIQFQAPLDALVDESESTEGSARNSGAMVTLAGVPYHGWLEKTLVSLRGERLVSNAENPQAAQTFDPANANDRGKLAAKIRERMKAKFGAKWTRQCGHAAAIALEELHAAGVATYRLAAGRVDESERYESITKRDRLCRYQGTYTGTGESEYHVWLVNDATNHKIDCSELPEERYNHAYLWEPEDPVPELDYIEKPEVTCIAVEKLKREYDVSVLRSTSGNQ
jgi:hypothetical protein